MDRVDLRGVAIVRGALNPAAQARVLSDLRGIVAAAPLFRPETRRGKQMSVRMTSAGRVGWVSDRRGYRYESRHPGGGAWPDMPRSLLTLWDAHAGARVPPDTCLVNFYGEGARMGLHQDRDEADLSHPVLSLSLGDDALFRVGNVAPGAPTESLWLSSGDLAVIGGAARLVHHGVDRIRFGSSRLLSEGGRVNVTLRVAT